MLVPGPWRHAKEVQRALRERGVSAAPTGRASIKPREIRVDVVETGGLADAFRWGRAGQLPEELLARIGACTRAALIEYGSRLDEAPEEVAKVGRALRDAGGLAVRMEASGGASAWEPWLEQLESGSPLRLTGCAVVLVEDDDGLIFTCGMHHFDLPDAQIRTDDPAEGTKWLDEFCAYQVGIGERPALLSGHAFRPSAEASPRTFERWPDHRHDPNDGRYNPFGLWRFLEPGADGIEPLQPVPVIIPPLVLALHAAERSAGHPLTRADVAKIVENSPAIAVEPRDVGELERSRGYADIEPDLAWDQWQIVRRTL
jgi:hypothetical protein